MRGRNKALRLLFAWLLGAVMLWGCGSVSADSGPASGSSGETALSSAPDDSGEAAFSSVSGVSGEAALSFASDAFGEAALPSASGTGAAAGAATGEEGIPAYEGRMELQYAENFTVDHYAGGYTLLTTTMDGARFLVVPEGKEVPLGLVTELESGTPGGGEVTVLLRPVENLYLVASSAMDLFSALDGLDAIAFSGLKEEDWYIEAARDAMERGDILYAGKYNKPDYERIVSGDCTLAIENMMISHSPEVMEKLEEFGIPVMIEYSSYESHPLGRVEWVRFYGALLGKEAEADRIFEEQRTILERVSAQDRTDKTAAFFFITSNGLVQVRQSNDYVPKMMELAGGNYIFEDLGDPDTKRSTINIQVEEFYAGAKEADFLIYNSSIDGGVPDVDALLDKCGLLADFKAVKEGNVWCTANDMYQQSLSIGYLIEDLYKMFRGECEDMHYLFHLE